MIIQELLEDLDNIEKVDVMKECITEKLDRSLKLYIDNLNKSCEEILNSDCMEIVKTISNKYPGVSR